MTTSSQTDRRSFLRTTAMAALVIVCLNPLVRAQAANQGKLGVALCAMFDVGVYPLQAACMMTGNVAGQSVDGKPNAKRLVVNKKEIEAENTLQLDTMLDAFAQSITGPPSSAPAKWACAPSASSKPATLRRTRGSQSGAETIACLKDRIA